MRQINLGGWERCEGDPGSPPLDDSWEHMDLRAGPGVTHVGDVRHLPEHWTGQYNEVRASHIIEHIHPNEVLDTVKEWARILKIGGTLRIYCPDARMLAWDLVNRRLSMDEYSRFMFGDQDYDLNLHRAAYDRERLDALVVSAGLVIAFKNPRPQSYSYDLGVQAMKVKA